MEIFNTILSALAGTLVSSVVAKAFIGRSLKDLETALNMCYKINERLAEINVRIGNIEPMQAMLLEHEKKLYAMRSKKDGRPSRHNSNGDS